MIIPYPIARDNGGIVALTSNHPVIFTLNQDTRTVATIDNGGPTALAVLGASYAAAGKTTEAMEILRALKQLSNERHVSPATRGREP